MGSACGAFAAFFLGFTSCRTIASHHNLQGCRLCAKADCGPCLRRGLRVRGRLKRSGPQGLWHCQGSMHPALARGDESTTLGGSGGKLPLRIRIRTPRLPMTRPSLPFSSLPSCSCPASGGTKVRTGALGRERRRRPRRRSIRRIAKTHTYGAPHACPAVRAEPMGQGPAGGIPTILWRNSSRARRCRVFCTTDETSFPRPAWDQFCSESVSKSYGFPSPVC